MLHLKGMVLFTVSNKRGGYLEGLTTAMAEVEKEPATQCIMMRTTVIYTETIS
jgi:hypothetical protein